MKLLMTIPGVGLILGSVIALEVGDVERFPGPQHLASYAGTVPRVYASGGRTRYSRTRPDVNRYLKWAFVEAANVIARHRKALSHRHVARLYERVRQSKGHGRAAIAVARPFGRGHLLDPPGAGALSGIQRQPAALGHG